MNSQNYFLSFYPFCSVHLQPLLKRTLENFTVDGHDINGRRVQLWVEEFKTYYGNMRACF